MYQPVQATFASKYLEQKWNEQQRRIAKAVLTGGSVLWRPAGGGDATTWPEVYAAVQASSTPLTILVERGPLDPSLAVPAGIYEMNQAEIVSTSYGDPNIQELLLADGAQLRNVKQFFGSITVVGHSTALACLENDFIGSGPPIFIVGFGAALRNDGTAPMIVVPTFSFSVLSLLLSGSVAYGGNSPVVQIANNAALWLQAFEGGSAVDPKGFAALGPNAQLFVSHNGNLSSSVGGTPGPTLPPFTSFTGLVGNVPWGTNGGSGPTNGAPGIAGRPAGLFSQIALGCSYFDTDLGKPVWFDNNGVTGWCDSAGVPA